MMKKCAISLLLALLCSCVQLEESPTTYNLYYLPRDATAGQGYQPMEWFPTTDQPVTPELLLAALITPRLSDLFATPFPVGTTVIHSQLNGNILTVRLSWHYSELSGISRTLADYSIVKTLCQLGSVEGVVLVVDGEEGAITVVKRQGDITTLVEQPPLT
ncbi:MAG: GerMN domain-containing protein [Eubacteriales bacterium]